MTDDTGLRSLLPDRVVITSVPAERLLLELVWDSPIADLDLHLIVDNYGTHKTPEVNAWLAKHPRFKLHFIPTSSSWLNLVERFFAEITGKRIRRGVFRSVAELEDAIHDYLDHHNANPKPFVWTKTAGDLLDKEARALEKRRAIESGNQALESEH